MKISLSCFDSFTAKFIQAKARQIVRCAGDKISREDVIQELVLALHSRTAKFDPNRGSWEAFVIVVVENQTATICQTLRKGLPLAVEPTEPIEGEDTRRAGFFPRSSQEAFELREDIAAVLDSLPPRLREICERLMYDSKTKVAKDMGTSRSAVYVAAKRIRSRFEKSNLREYLK